MRFNHLAIRPVNTEYGDFISQLLATAVEADGQLEYTDQGVLFKYSVAFHEPRIIGNSESQIGQFISGRSTESSVMSVLALLRSNIHLSGPIFCPPNP